VDGQGDARYPEVHVWDLPSTEPPPPEPTPVTVTIDGTTTEHLCYTSATLASATESFSIDC